MCDTYFFDATTFTFDKKWVKEVCEKIKALGLDFGIWVEPEMGNMRSELCEKHPDYKFQIENKYSKDPLYGIKSLTLKCIN